MFHVPVGAYDLQFASLPQATLTFLGCEDIKHPSVRIIPVDGSDSLPNKDAKRAQSLSSCPPHITSANLTCPSDSQPAGPYLGYLISPIHSPSPSLPIEGFLANTPMSITVTCRRANFTEHALRSTLRLRCSLLSTSTRAQVFTPASPSTSEQISRSTRHGLKATDAFTSPGIRQLRTLFSDTLPRRKREERDLKQK